MPDEATEGRRANKRMRLQATRHAGHAVQEEGGVDGAAASPGRAHLPAQRRQPHDGPGRAIGAEELCGRTAIDLGASDTGESGSGEDGSSSQSGDSLDGFIQDDLGAGGDGEEETGSGISQQQQGEHGEEDGSEEEDNPDGLKAWAWQTTGYVAPRMHAYKYLKPSQPYSSVKCLSST